MSTYLYLVCNDHRPPIRADAESGQHLYDLPQIRSDIANRSDIEDVVDDGWTHHDHFRMNSARFLTAHPLCDIGIRDEYGVDHPLTSDAEAMS